MSEEKVSQTADKSVPVTVYVPVELYRRIEEQRGLAVARRGARQVPNRSDFIRELMDEGLRSMEARNRQQEPTQ